jgi:hypothetical protein
MISVFKDWLREHEEDEAKEKAAEAKALATVKRSKDQRVLADLAKSGPYRSVRLAAILRLREDGALGEVALSAWEAAEHASEENSDSFHQWEQHVEGFLNEFRSAIKRMQDEQLLFGIFQHVIASPMTHLEKFYENESCYRYVGNIVKGIHNASLLKHIVGDIGNHPRSFWYQSVSQAAVFNIEDQDLLKELARPEMFDLHKSWSYTAEAAVAKIEDLEFLIEVARKHPHFSVRNEAIKKIDDPSILADFACFDPHEFVRMRIVECRLSDQATLIGIATSDKDSSVRKAAVKKIEDQLELASIAHHDSDPDIRREAVWKITDQKLLINIAERDGDGYVRASAIERIESDNRVEEIVLKEKEPQIRRRFLGRIASRKTIEHIMRNDEDYYTRMLAALYHYDLKRPQGYVQEELEEAETQLVWLTQARNDIPLMRDIATHGNDPVARVSALEAVPDLERELKKEALSVIVKGYVNKLRERIETYENYWHRRANLDSGIRRHIGEPCKRAIRMMDEPELRDQRLLADVALLEAAGLRQLRILAMERLTDQEILKEVFENATYSTVRRIALNHLHDAAYLRDYASRDPAPIVLGRLTFLDKLSAERSR